MTMGSGEETSKLAKMLAELKEQVRPPEGRGMMTHQWLVGSS